MKKLLVGLTAVVIGLSAMAQDRETRPRMGGGHQQEMMEKLNLTAEQKEKMKAIREESRKQMEELKTQKFSEEVMSEKRRTIMESNREKMRAVLTEEQKKQWDAMKPEGKPEGGRGFGGGKAEGKPEGKPEGGPKHDGEKMERLQQVAKDLNLTPEQTTKFINAHTAQRDKINDIRSNTTLTEEQRKDQLKGIKKDFRAAIKGILTTEQINKLKEMKKNQPHMKGDEDDDK